MRSAVEIAIACALVLAACKDESAGDEGDGAAEDSSDDGAESTAAASEDDGSGSDESESAGAGSTGGDWTSFEERPCPEDSFLTFENFGAMYMLNYCTGCHSSGLPADQRQMAPIEVNFDSLEDVRALADRIWARAGDQNATMPPAGAAPADERALLGEWLACGAPTDADLGL